MQHLSLLRAACALCAFALAADLPRAQHTITFEEAVPVPAAIRSQYCNDPLTSGGVEFLGTQGIVVPGVATASGTHALTNAEYASEFAFTRTLRVRFTTGQGSVALKTGLTEAYAWPVYATLRAYATGTPGAGPALDTQTVLLGQGPTPITTLLQVTDAANRIRSIELECKAAGTGGWVVETIDDLTLSHVGPPCLVDTVPPTVTILEPTAGQTLNYPRARLHFEVFDPESGVASQRIQVLDANLVVLQDYALCGVSDAPACNYLTPPTLSSFDNEVELPPGAQAIRVEATDFAGNVGTATRLLDLRLPGPNLNLWVESVELNQGEPGAVHLGVLLHDGIGDRMIAADGQHTVAPLQQRAQARPDLRVALHAGCKIEVSDVVPVSATLEVEPILRGEVRGAVE